MTLSWPSSELVAGDIALRAFDDGDLPMVLELATDPYVAAVSSLDADADTEQGLAWIGRQRGRLAEGAGFSFCIAERKTGRAVGFIGLWTGPQLAFGRATAGYSVCPSGRGHGVARDALRALTVFAWTIPGLHRIELYIEPGNPGSRRTAESAGYLVEGRLRSHQEIAGDRRDMLVYSAIRPTDDGSCSPVAATG